MKSIDIINKKYGSNLIRRLGDTPRKLVPVIPTGCISIDNALGVGGIPRGRIIEIYGPESSGKTTLCQHIIANSQALGGKAAFIDVENALDPDWLIKTGVDVDELYLCQPDYGEQALDICEILIPDFDVIIVDSVAALSPKAEIEGEMGDSHMGLTARLMGQALRKISPIASKANTTIIFTNQLRQKLGVMFGSPETTPGGMALKYFASMRLDLRKRNTINDKSDNIIGNEVRLTVKKNKVAKPFSIVDFEILYDEGISYTNDLIKLAIESGNIQKKASWFIIGEEKIQGEKNLKEFVTSNPKFYQTLDDSIRKHYGYPLKRINNE